MSQTDLFRMIFSMTTVFILAACGGGGGSSEKSSPVLSMSLSKSEVELSASSRNPIPTATVNLSISGTIPTTGLYYGWNASINGIEKILSAQIDNTTAQLTIYFKNPSTLSLGSYRDVITVMAATDKTGINQIANSPQMINTTFNVILPPPQITALNPVSAYVGGPDFTLAITGSGFPTNSQVFWNGQPIQTSFVSDKSLTARIPAQAIASSGSAQLTIGGANMETSSAVAFPVANSQATFIDVPAADIVWDRVNQVFYGAIMSDAAMYPNSIAVIDPLLGRITRVVPTGPTSTTRLTGPVFLAISEDSSYLYASSYIDQPGVSSVIQRFNLPALTLDTSFSITYGTAQNTQDYYTQAMQVAPNSPRTIAISRGLGGLAGGVAIYDDGVQRGSAILDAPGGSVHYLYSLQWGADASTLYAAGAFTNTMSAEYSAIDVGPSGPSIRTDLTSYLTPGGYDLHMVSSSGKMFVGNGQVLDPSTGKILGSFGTSFTGMVPDPTLGIGFFLGQNTPIASGLWNINVSTYDLPRLTLLSTTAIPIMSIPNTYSFSPRKLFRCGSSMLALSGSTASGGSGGICILTGPFAQGK